jgi:tRNA(Ile)-lysidine synthase
MIPLTQHVRAFIDKHQMLSAEDRILVGVSGGADSVALLLVLRELGYTVAAAHLNHGLRGAESDEDERFVAELAATLGAPCFTRRVSIADRGGNVEAAGRAARKEFFQDLAREHGFTKVALAHNREDRVETFLLHLMRGAGTEGLISMAAVSGVTVRPLLETPRNEIEEYLQFKRQSWHTDRTNADISFVRNRIRHEALPQLASSFNVRLVESLSRTVSILQDEDDWMAALTESWLAQHGTSNGPNPGLDAEALRAVPAALARRVIRTSLRRAGSFLTDVTYDHIESIRGLLDSGKSGKVIPLPGGLIAAREFDRLVFLSGNESTAEFDYALEIPGAVHIPELRQVFRAQCLESSQEADGLEPSPARVFVDGSRLGACVKIRNWKPGDYYKPAGWPAGKVKKLFQRARVPRSQRCRWPIFVTDSTIVWVASFPVSREFIPGGHTQKIVAFEALPD